MNIIREYFIPILPTPALRINSSVGKGNSTWVLHKTDEELKFIDNKKKLLGLQGYSYRRKKSLEKYFGFKDELAFWFKKNNIEPPYSSFSIEFRMPIGASIRAKEYEKRLGADHDLRPDFDNCVKAFLDAFKKRKTMMWFDYNDCVSNRIFISKVWCKAGDEGIRIREYDYLDL